MRQIKDIKVFVRTLDSCAAIPHLACFFHFSLLLPKQRNSNTDPETVWYAQSVPSSGCCADCSCSRRGGCSRFSSLTPTSAHISYSVHNCQLYTLCTAGGAVGSHCNVLAPCSIHCAGVEGAVPLADGDALDAGSIDAIGEISNKLPLGGSTERRRGRTAGWWADHLTHWAGNICHLETWKQETL